MTNRAAHSVFWLALALALTQPALAQQGLIQGDPPVPGHVPNYATRGYGQPVLRDGGDAGGSSQIGKNPSEIGLSAIDPQGNYPSASSGHGPYGEHFCLYDAPTSNTTGYHFMCLDPNAQGSGLFSYGAAGGATPLSLKFNVNGITQTFPFTQSSGSSSTLQVFDIRYVSPAAKCDGVTDDYPAMFAAEKLAESVTGGAVYIPSTGHACLTSHGLALGNGVGVVGAGGAVNPGNNVTVAQMTQAGSWIQSTDTVNPTVFGQGSGNFINGVNFIRQQPIPSSVANTAYTPTTYPFEIMLTGSFDAVNNVRMIGVTNGLSLNYSPGSGGGSFTWLSHVDIDAMGISLQTNNVNDTVYLNDFHARTWYYAGNSNLITYREANAIGWDMHYTDNMVVNGIECFQTASCIAATDGTAVGNQHSGYNLQISGLGCNLVVTCLNLASGSTITGRFSDIIAEQDTGRGLTNTLFSLPSDHVDLQIGSMNVITTGGSVMALGGGAGGSVQISTLNLGTTANLNPATIYGYSTNASNQPAFSMSSGSEIQIGQRNVVRQTTAGAFAAGAGSANMVMPMTCWHPFGYPGQLTITGTNATAVFTSINEQVGAASGNFLQMRLIAQPNVTVTQSGTITLQMQSYQTKLDGSTAISLTFPASASGLATLGDTNWVDINGASGGIIGAATQGAPTSAQFTFGTFSACFR